MARGVSSLKVELQCTECSDYYVLRKCESKWCCNCTFAVFVEWSVSFAQVSNVLEASACSLWSLPESAQDLCVFLVLGD